LVQAIRSVAAITISSQAAFAAKWWQVI